VTRPEPCGAIADLHDIKAVIRLKRNSYFIPPKDRRSSSNIGATKSFPLFDSFTGSKP